MHSFKKFIFDQWILESSRPFFLDESVQGKKWVFSYMDQYGDIKMHPIIRIDLGSLTIYKNGSIVFANDLGKLVRYLSQGAIKLLPCPEQKACVV